MTQIVYMIAALRPSLKNWHYDSKYAKHLLADRLAEGENADEMAITAIIDGFQEGIFNGACINSIPEENIVNGMRAHIIPKMTSTMDQGLAIMRLMDNILECIDKLIPRVDAANNKYLGDVAYSIKHGKGMIWRELFGNNETEE